MSLGATFDTRRRALGLSAAETAVWLGVRDRMVNRWIADEEAPREGWSSVLNRLDDLEEIMDGIAGGIVAAATDLTDAGPVRLDRYRTQAELDADMAEILTPANAGFRLPLGSHAILTAWVDEQLAAQGVATRIEWAG